MIPQATNTARLNITITTGTNKRGYHLEGTISSGKHITLPRVLLDIPTITAFLVSGATLAQLHIHIGQHCPFHCFAKFFTSNPQMILVALWDLQLPLPKFNRCHYYTNLVSNPAAY